MASDRWKMALCGLVLLAFLPASQALARPLDPALGALVSAGDVDGVAATLAQMASTGNADLTATMEEIAHLNPDIAGAVVNATVRALAAGGSTPQNLAPVIQNLVAGAMKGVAGTISPDQAEVYAENIATNVRQVIGAIAQGDQNTQNALLASARAGVAQSGSSQQGATGVVLHSDVSVRLQGTIDPEEAGQAVEADPVVVSHGGTVEQPGNQENNNNNNNNNNNQNNNQQGQQQPPAPVTDTPEENPGTDVRDASPS